MLEELIFSTDSEVFFKSTSQSVASFNVELITDELFYPILTD